MKKKFIYFSILILIFALSCTKDDVGTNWVGKSKIDLQVNFLDKGNKIKQKNTLNKTADITRVRVTVSGPGMDDVVENLSLNGNTASGSVSVPKGDNRNFLIEGIDGRGIIQFEGDATKDLRNDSESVSVSVVWIPPPPINLSVDNVTSSSVDISWSRSNAQDFAYYRILLSTSSNLDAKNDKLLDITDVNNTSGTIRELDPETEYYVAVIVVDTEGWFNTNAEVLSFTTEAAGGQVVEIAYDDNSRESGLYGPKDSWLTVNFDADQYPARIITMKIFLTNNSIGDEVGAFFLDNSDGTEIFRLKMPPTNDGWMEITPDWSQQAHNGVVENDFDMGVAYLVSKDQELPPVVAADTSSTYQGRSWFRASDGTWSNLDEIGFAWNLMIRAVVELPTGKRVTLTPSKATLGDRRSSSPKDNQQEIPIPMK